MNFEFSADQMHLKDIARKFLEKEGAVERARNVLEGEESFDENLWQQIIEMGFTATAIPEEYGGLGLGYLELCVIAEELGRSLAPTPFSSSVYLATEAILNSEDDSLKQNYLPSLANGEKLGLLLTASQIPLQQNQIFNVMFQAMRCLEKRSQ